MARALKVCSQPGCAELCAAGRCPTHTRAADQARGTATQRGYGSTWRRTSRRATLLRDPLCTCSATTPEHGCRCVAQSAAADHWPTSRRDLIAQGVSDPDALHRLRGVCKPCHDRHTADEAPGGWAR